mmetsp:Transcript_2590/g.5448  ORF Transcript_2590/g.5448 Transcript_2590/m.5448 type:complete len:211 (-) Transcript_2590:609-1241(-)
MRQRSRWRLARLLFFEQCCHWSRVRPKYVQKRGDPKNRHCGFRCPPRERNGRNHSPVGAHGRKSPDPNALCRRGTGNAAVSAMAGRDGHQQCLFCLDSRIWTTGTGICQHALGGMVLSGERKIQHFGCDSGSIFGGISQSDGFLVVPDVDTNGRGRQDELLQDFELWFGIAHPRRGSRHATFGRERHVPQKDFATVEGFRSGYYFCQCRF